MRLLNYSPASADARALWQQQLRQPHLYSRAEDFRVLIRQVTDSLQRFCHTDAQVLLLTSAGTGALECAIAALPKNKRILVIRNGYFGDRLYEIAKLHFSEVYSFDLPFGEPLSHQHEQTLQTAALDFHADVLVAVHLETSSTILNDISMVGQLGRELNALTIVDGISSVGAVDCRLQEWGINCFVGSVYKALLGPVGLSFILADESYLSQIRSDWSYYFDVSRLMKTAENDSYLWSPNVLILHCLQSVLDGIFVVGQDQYFEQLREKADSFRNLLASKGLTVFGNSAHLSPCFTAIMLQPDFADKWLSLLKQEHGIIIGKGLKYYPENLLRLGHYPNRSIQELEQLAEALAEVSQRMLR